MVFVWGEVNEYNHDKPQHKTVDVSSKIRTWHLPNASPKCYRLGKISRTLYACGNECTVFFEMQMLTTGEVKTQTHFSVSNNSTKLENGRKVVESSWNVMAHGDAREGKWRGKLANGVDRQYPSHHLGTWYIQYYYRWCAHIGCK
jgi:hypothetical protein